MTMKRITLLLLAATAALFSTFSLPGQNKPVTPTEEEALMRHWIATLGSDDFGGRMPMTPYEDKTIQYLAHHRNRHPPG